MQVSNAAPSNDIVAFTKGKEVIAEIYYEKINNEEKNFQNNGFDSPINALNSFFFLSMNEDHKNIIDMHYDKDGSKNYVTKLLKKNPKAFSGSVNLKSLYIAGIFYWGKHRIVDFKITNKSNSSMRWFEDFVCIENICKKSNYLNIFGNSGSRTLFSQLYRSPKIQIEDFDTSNYLNINLTPDFAQDSLYPIRLHYKVSKITKADKKSKWYELLKKIEFNGVKKTSDNLLERMSFLKTYIPSIFGNWGVNKKAYFRFNSSWREKELLISSLSVTNAVNIDSYLESDDKVWVFVSALDNKKSRSNFIFLYNKATSLFELEPPKKGDAQIIDGFVRNKIFENKVFDEEINRARYN